MVLPERSRRYHVPGRGTQSTAPPSLILRCTVKPRVQSPPVGAKRRSSDAFRCSIVVFVTSVGEVLRRKTHRKTRSWPVARPFSRVRLGDPVWRSGGSLHHRGVMYPACSATPTFQHNTHSALSPPRSWSLSLPLSLSLSLGLSPPLSLSLPLSPPSSGYIDYTRKRKKTNEYNDHNFLFHVQRPQVIIDVH